MRRGLGPVCTACAGLLRARTRNDDNGQVQQHLRIHRRHLVRKPTAHPCLDVSRRLLEHARRVIDGLRVQVQLADAHHAVVEALAHVTLLDLSATAHHHHRLRTILHHQLVLVTCSPLAESYLQLQMPPELLLQVFCLVHRLARQV